MKNHPIEIRVQGQAFDDQAFPLGVIRISSSKSVTYLNRAIRAMLGGELSLGMQITDLPLDPESRRALDAAIEERFEEHRGGGYALVVNRRDTGTVVRGRVAAVPEYEQDGSLRGSIGFIVDESLDVAAAAIYREMEQALAPTDLLRALAQTLRQVLAFDSFMVTAIGKDNLHLRSLFEAPDPPPSPSQYRWWPMPAFVRTMLQNLEPGPMDLDELYEDPEYARLSETDFAASEFRKRNFRHTLRLSVRSKGLQVAVITLLRRREEPAFTDADLKLCLRLPVIEAVTWSMAIDEQLQHRFAIELIAKLTEVDHSAQAVAQRLVDELWDHFKWEHVSLFRVVEDRDRVRLVCQAKSEQRRLPEGFEQTTARGLLGRCVRTKKAVNVGKVKLDDDYQEGIKGIESELVMPLPGPQLRWLLNIESSTIDAFAEEEQHAVAMLLRVVAFVLERSAVLELHAAIMDNVADAVIQTNEWNTIRDVNHACTRLLGRSREEMVGHDLASFLAVNEVAAPIAGAISEGHARAWAEVPAGVSELDSKANTLIQTDMRASEVIRFARRDGSSISMLVSTATIPGEFGGKVFIASDLSGKQYLDRVGKLMPVFRQLASEIRVPLSLAAAYVEDCREEGTSSADAQDLLDKATKLIQRADMSVERVMHAAGAADGAKLLRTRFELRKVTEEVLRDLPNDKRRTVEFSADGPEPVEVEAAFSELRFCVDTLMSLLLKICSRDEPIEVRTGREDDGVHAFISLRSRGNESPQLTRRDGQEARSAEEMITVEAVVPTLMDRMGGTYLAPEPGLQQFKLLISLAR